MHKVMISTAFLLAFSASAEAVTVDPATLTKLEFGGGIYANQTTNNPYHNEGDFGGVLVDLKNTGYTQHRTVEAFSSVDINLSKAPSITSRSEAGKYFPGSTTAKNNASLAYYFRVDGPATTSPVSVRVVAKGESTQSGPLTSTSGIFSLQGVEGLVLGATLAGTDSFAIDQLVSLTANSVYMVFVNVATFAASGGRADSSRSAAMIDPYFAIDGNLPGYSLAFSRGINNSQVAATPIPASAVLFGTALLGLGVAGLRRQRAA